MSLLLALSRRAHDCRECLVLREQRALGSDKIESISW
jgi:hypothetical protein